MIKLESNTLKNYYGEKPNDYDVKFIHYSLDVEDGEYEEIYNDLKNSLDGRLGEYLFIGGIFHV